MTVQQACSDWMIPDDRERGVAAPISASKSDIPLVSAVISVYNDPDKNWLAAGRKYPVIDGRSFCPQCLLDSWHGSSELVLQQLLKSYPKSYVRNEDVRRHLRTSHKMGHLQNQSTGF
jgi:hypothetical protein